MARSHEAVHKLCLWLHGILHVALRADTVGESQDWPCTDLVYHALNSVHITILNACCCCCSCFQNDYHTVVVMVTVVNLVVVSFFAGSPGEDGGVGDLHELRRIKQSW